MEYHTKVEEGPPTGDGDSPDQKRHEAGTSSGETCVVTPVKSTASHVPSRGRDETNLKFMAAAGSQPAMCDQ